MGLLINLIISVLQSPRDKPVLQEHVKSLAMIPSGIGSELLEELQHEHLVYLRKGMLEVDSAQRVMLALKAFELGADVETISHFLEWKEFEKVAALTLKTYSYNVETNVRFKERGRWWELDVVGWHEPLVVCVDCKHWHRFSPSKVKAAVEAQMKRTLAFSKSPQAFPSGMNCFSWSDVKFVPVILSLIPAGFKFHDGIPVVPVLQLRNFLAQLPLQLDSMKWFSRPSTFRTLS